MSHTYTSAVPPSLNSVAAMIGDTKAQETVKKFKDVIEKFRQEGQWIVFSPQGEMFVGTDRDMMRVLMTKISIAECLRHGLKL